MIKNKLKASIYHLLISLSVVSCILLFVFNYWYPGVLSEVSGLAQIVFIMVAIDLVLGPLLTFVVYRKDKSKRALTLDFAVIGAVQITALVYATHTIYQGHPIYVTYAADRFTVITANEVDPKQAIHDRFKKSKLAGPDLAFAKQPDDPKEAEAIMFGVLNGAPDIDKRPNLYEPIEKHLDDVFAKSIKVERLLAREDTKKEFMKFIDKHGDHEQFALLPLSGQGKDVIWALSKETGKPVDIINVNPWAMVVNAK